ncbi:MAG: deoxyribose-phosphate aldolase [Vicingaceae bacterium]
MAFNIKNIPSLNTSQEFNTTTEIERIINSPLNINDEKTIHKLILSLIDFTTLEGADTTTKVEDMCNTVLELEANTSVPNVAAICIYPTFANLVNNMLKETNVNTACVAGAFPSGQSSLAIKLQEIKWAIEEGATEIDMVISRGKLLEGNYQEVFDEIVAIKECCGDVHLKVIIESGELENNQNIRIASDLAMYAGADFIKTSTGKISEGATYNSVYIMLNAIKDFQDATGKKIGMKPAGGISDIPTAINYLKIVENTVGKEWLSPSLFRFGASSLAKVVLEKLL